MPEDLPTRLLRQQDAITLPSGRTLAVGQRVRVRTSDARVRGLSRSQRAGTILFLGLFDAQAHAPVPMSDSARLSSQCSGGTYDGGAAAGGSAPADAAARKHGGDHGGAAGGGLAAAATDAAATAASTGASAIVADNGARQRSGSTGGMRSGARGTKATLGTRSCVWLVGLEMAAPAFDVNIYRALFE